MDEAPPPVVMPYLPVLGHEERAVVVAEVGDRRPATLVEGRPSTSTAVVPDASVGSRSCSGAATPRTRSPSSPSTMSWRRSLGIIFVSIPRRR